MVAGVGVLGVYHAGQRLDHLEVEVLQAFVELYVLERDGGLAGQQRQELQVVVGEGFLFDGRSGPWILDWYEPNLGTLDKRIAWWVHDVLGHGTSFDFKTTNEILRQLLVIAGDRKTKASFVRYSVSLSSSWFGVPKKGDKSFPNMDKISVTYKGIVL